MLKSLLRFRNRNSIHQRTLKLQPLLECLESRLLMDADSTYPPGFITGEFGKWNPLGPFSATNGQVENIAGKPVSGALSTVLAHPTNPNVLYVGSVNGGVWRTNNATQPDPLWIPLTDRMPSQSIGALALDEANPSTIYAGIGRYSSFYQLGNDRTGLLKSTDSGSNWQVLDSGGLLRGMNISGIYANGNTVVISVNVADNYTNATIGIFRSTNGGNSFTQVSGAASTGLPFGTAYDLVYEKPNPNVLYTSVVFSPTAANNGVYKSTDGGAIWTKVSSAAMNALITNNTSNLEMATGRSNEVYAGIINAGALAGLFRSPDNGATWTAMDLPMTNETGGGVGLNPSGGKGPNSGPVQGIAGGQGAIHFSIVADPTNANIVYVGGDRQPRGFQDLGSFPNAIGANDFSGRLFRGDASRPSGSQFVHLTHRNDRGAPGGGTASNSSPHADSRDMTFDANGILIEVDDGGVYRRTSPQSNLGDWFSLNGNLQVTESHDVAWDSLSNVAMTGNQDTGTTYQTAANATLWDSISTADGGDIAIDNIELAATNQSVRYSSFQNLGAFRRTVWNAAGELVSTSFPALRPINNSAAIFGAFVTPVVTNAILGRSLLIHGNNGLYESLDAGATVNAIGSGLAATANAIWYGGRKGGVNNPEVVWAASSSDVYHRTTGTGNVTRTVGDPTTSTIVDLVIDSNDYSTAFVIDNNQVFQSKDQGSTWTDVTGNLMTNARELYSVTFVDGVLSDYVVVGTNTGVFVSSTARSGEWTSLGQFFPRVITYDLEYDHTDDILVAGTMGRGAWSLSSVVGVLEIALSVDMGTGGNFVEDGPAVLVAPAATVTQTNTVNMDGASLDVTIAAGMQTGDTLSLASTNGISLSGNDVQLNGTTIASVTNKNANSFSLRFNASAVASSLETILRSIEFANTTNNPRTVVRTVQALYAGKLNAVVNVTVTPTNDAPSLSQMTMSSILEDIALPIGQSISQVAGEAFSDPDENARLAGVVVVGNPQNGREGTWYYSTSTTWTPIGLVSNANGLVLSRNTRIGFLPSPDYFGTPAPLLVKALDETYTGQFTAADRVFFDPSRSLPTTISVAAAPISIEVTNVNDPPQATSQSLEVSVLQDKPIDTVVDSLLFTDIDSTLTYSILSSGSSIPDWLGFDSQTLLLSGTPSNRDVGVYNLRLAVSDGEYAASIPLIINVINVNDAPEQLRLIGGNVDEGRAAVQIGTLFAFDPDGDNVFWSSTDPRFSVRDGQIIINTVLNFENPLERSIPVSFRATDTGSPALSSTLDVIINVQDVNEFFPQLRGKVYRLIDGDPADKLIDRLVAPDNDSEQTVRYRLVSGDVDDFTIDELTGELRLANEANMDEKSTFKVFIEAYDDGAPSSATTAQFDVHIDPANFFVPEFDDSQILSFPENLPAGTLVGRVRVNDGDDNPLRFTLVSVVGGKLDWVNLDPLTGDVFLTDAHQFDFESPQNHSLVVRVEETINGGKIVAGNLPISLINRNDPPAAIGDLAVFPNRFGVSVTANFEVEDQDVSPTGYAFATQDSRFEVRSGKLALKTTEVLTSAMVGETIDVLVRVTDKGDSNSFSDLIAAVRVIAAPAWQNQANPLDVNRDGIITPTDANLIISRLGSGTDGAVLSLPRSFVELGAFDIDVTGDNFVSASDALLVINFLNEQAAGEGEGEALDSVPNQSPKDADSATWLLAYNQIEEDLLIRRRR